MHLSIKIKDLELSLTDIKKEDLAIVGILALSITGMILVPTSSMKMKVVSAGVTAITTLYKSKSTDLQTV